MVIFRQFFQIIKNMPFYAVARGRQTGIFNTWPECQAQVQGLSGPIFKKFNTMNEAEDFVNQRGNSNETHTRFNSISLGSTSSSTSIASKRSYSDDKSSAAPKSKKSKIDEKKTAEFTKDIVKMARYGKYDFMQDIDGYVQVYTDGACENNGKPTAVAGKGVWFGDGHALNESSPVSGRATNNCGEIQAATDAINKAANNGVTKLCINTDSHFVINSVTKWMAGWKRRGWNKADGKPVQNQIDFRELDTAINQSKQMNIKWKYVPAHIGIHGNERADALAKQGAQEFKKLNR